MATLCLWCVWFFVRPKSFVVRTPPAAEAAVQAAIIQTQNKVHNSIPNALQAVNPAQVNPRLLVKLCPGSLLLVLHGGGATAILPHP